jgi:CheY-like chemotaxis protein
MSGKAQTAGAWGADTRVEYLSKPFKPEDLLNTVEKLLKGQALP